MRLALAAWLCLAASCAEPIAGDADRGRDLFRSFGCIACHSVDGQGGGYAPDLAKRIGREQTPLDMAAGMWNRGPMMWSWIAKKRLTLPEPGEQEMADFYAYFYSARYFDKPGDAARGRKLFYWKRCADCHRLEGEGTSQGPPPAQWPPLPDPVALVERMWNDSGIMRDAMTRKRLAWPELTAQEAADLHALARTFAEPGPPAGELPLVSSQPGDRLFESKGCRTCHSGARSLRGRFSGRTLTDFAIAMWNSAPQMGKRVPLDYGEMRQLAGYLWRLQIPQPAASAKRGRELFSSKGCAACHNRGLSGAPRLAAHRLYPFTLMSLLWRHGPSMQLKLAASGRSWPRLTAAELADITAALSAETLRVP